MQKNKKSKILIIAGLAVAIIILIKAIPFLVEIKILDKTTHFRGNAIESKDGKTYLVIEDMEGTDCSVNNKKWPHREGSPGIISPGIHKIKCHGEVEFDIPPRVVFHFSYWGP